MDKIPFYPNIEDFNNDEIFNNNYHPESFDLLNYYKVFEDNDNKSFIEKSEEKEIASKDFGYEYSELENTPNNYHEI
ncbi:hypothetical protein SAMN02745227_00030 [Anaerobranca californiensis DSM 14826]|jgi:hypothetical protein|uniref:Uncharacterized protein n=1 Tax=Anaerobranca californiensis DSM 14826 TaxID=1120989 RepID=A0A1M6K8R1_9FIRM|nr:hypothetical protein [Anaerobranca californiensis]SHJ55314.1 hypothetical protein SAMN02745227_00030 [Anaerobranca californiensis DSM 14826]